MASTHSKWSISVKGDDKRTLKLKINARRTYHFLCIPIVVLYTLILCGCVTKAPGIPRIFIGELHDSQNATGLRFGYFGICTNSNNGSYSCSSSVLSSPESFATSHSAPLLLIQYAYGLQRSISYVILSTASVLFFAGLNTLLILKITIKKQSSSDSLILGANMNLDKHIKHLNFATRLMLWTSTVVSLLAAYSTTCALTSLQVATSPTIGTVSGGKLVRGTSVEVMQWTAFGFSLLFAICVDMMAGPPKSRSGFRDKLDKIEKQTEVPSLDKERMATKTPPGQHPALRVTSLKIARQFGAWV